MGKAMAKHGLDPDLVLCSTARRTRDTLALVLPELKPSRRSSTRTASITARPRRCSACCTRSAPGSNQVLLVGHNPELQSFALDLIGSGAKHLKDRLEAKYPTAGLVVLRFPGRRLEGCRHQQRQARAVPDPGRREEELTNLTARGKRA